MEGLHVSSTWMFPVALPINRPGTAPRTVSLMFSHRDVCLHLSLVDGVPYAAGTGNEKGEARENAARNCYLILNPQ